MRAHLPGYLRLLAGVLGLIGVISLAGVAYTLGRNSGGHHDKTANGQELDSLRAQVDDLRSEMERLRAVSNGSEASLQIERTVQQKLGDQLKLLEGENSRLKEELAAFEKLASGEEKNQTFAIHQIRVTADPTMEGTYRYRFLLAAPASRPDREFVGRFQMVATVQQAGGTVIVNIPGAGAPDVQKFLLKFKYFRRVEGSFMLPAGGGALRKLEVRLLQGDTVLTTQQISM